MSIDWVFFVLRYNLVAIVTGGGSGIGRAIAVGFSKEGAKVRRVFTWFLCFIKVGITDQNKQTAKETAEIIHLLGGQAYAVEMDVCDEQQVDLGVQNIIKKFGKLDVMICNAGIQFISSVNELSYSDWKRVLSVHLDGAFLCTRAALKQMYKPENGGGSIIYMGSVHSKEASVLKAPYVAAKVKLTSYVLIQIAWNYWTSKNCCERRSIQKCKD